MNVALRIGAYTERLAAIVLPAMLAIAVLAFWPLGAVSGVHLKNGLVLLCGGIALLYCGFRAYAGTARGLFEHPLTPGLVLCGTALALGFFVHGMHAWYAFVEPNAPGVFIAGLAICFACALLVRTHGSAPLLHMIVVTAVAGAAIDLFGRFATPILGGALSNMGADQGAWFYGGAIASLFSMLYLGALHSRLMRALALLGLCASLFLLASASAAIPVALLAAALACLALSVMSRVLSARPPEGVSLWPIGAALLIMGIAFLLFYRGAPSGPDHPGLDASWRIAAAFATEADPIARFVGGGGGAFQYWWSYAKPEVSGGVATGLADFANGTGIVSVSLLTGGVLGSAAFLVLLAHFFIRCLKVHIDSYALDPARTTWAVSGLYAVGALTLGPVDPQLTVFLFVAMGASIGATVPQIELVRTAARVRRWSRIAASGLLALFGLALAGAGIVQAYVHIEYDRAVFAFERDRDVELARARLDRARALYPYPPANRARSQVDQYAAESMILRDSERTEGQVVFDTLNHAVDTARQAVEEDPYDYYNALVLGNVHTQLAGLGLEGSDEKAAENYRRAQALSPRNPAPRFLMARLYAILGDTERAHAEVEASLALVPSYEPARALRDALAQ
jgi:hypothetical protein